MNWTEQAESMAKAWADAQKKLWEDWYELNQAASASAPFGPDFANQWRKMASQGFETWTANADATAQQVSQRLFESQQATTRFLDFVFKAWQDMADKVANNQDWQAVLSSYVEQLRRQLSPDMAFKVGQDSEELWQLYLKQLEQFTKPWLETWQKTPPYFSQNGTGALDLTKLYWDTYEQTFSRWLNSPGLGYTRELDNKIRKGFQTWQQYRRIDMEYQVMVAQAWVKLFEKLQLELVALAQKGETIQSLEQLATLWYELADPIFIEVFRSEPYIRKQGELLSATMALRIQQRDMVELWLKSNDIPTRTEVDVVHRNIYEQRKEIKALKKALAGLSHATETEAETRIELNKTQKTIKSLQSEIKTLKEALTTATAAAGQSESLQQEILALKQAVEKLGQAKPTTRKTTGRRRKTTAKKAKTADTTPPSDES